MSSTYIPSALRRLVYDRAGGCCEYCLLPEAAAFASHEKIELSSLQHVTTYTPEQIDAGIPQDISGPLFFIVVN